MYKHFMIKNYVNHAYNNTSYKKLTNQKVNTKIRKAEAPQAYRPPLLIPKGRWTVLPSCPISSESYLELYSILLSISSLQTALHAVPKILLQNSPSIPHTNAMEFHYPRPHPDPDPDLLQESSLMLWKIHKYCLVETHIDHCFQRSK